MSIPRTNNFDLVRLLAASQVVVGHICTEVAPAGSAVLLPAVWWMGVFPGVPIFFTVSGFLIYWSFERNADHIGSFFKNRFLRIYPGLWVCFAVTLAVLAVFGQISAATLGQGRLLGLGRPAIDVLPVRHARILQALGRRPGESQPVDDLDRTAILCLGPADLLCLETPGQHWYDRLGGLFFGSIGVYAVAVSIAGSNILHEVKDVGICQLLVQLPLWHRLLQVLGPNRVLVEGRFLYWLAAYVAFVCLSWTDTRSGHIRPSRSA